MFGQRIPTSVTQDPDTYLCAFNLFLLVFLPRLLPAPRGASAHVTQDNFLFNSTLINGALIEILHRTQQCSPASTSSQYRGHLSRWRGQSGECDIGKIITRRGKHGLQQWGCLTGQGDPDCLSFQLRGETEGHLLIVMLFYWLSKAI